jgi:hypothetical protein
MSILEHVSERPLAARFASSVIFGGFIAGTIDIFAAALISHLSPVAIMRIIAGGLLGKTALQGGWEVALLGLVLQWAMSLLIAAIFTAAALRLRWMTARPWVAGLAYGVVVYFVMNYLVLPLSAWHHTPAFKPVLFAENMLAMLVFGVIIAFCARHALRIPGSRS